MCKGGEELLNQPGLGTKLPEEEGPAERGAKNLLLFFIPQHKGFFVLFCFKVLFFIFIF